MRGPQGVDLWWNGPSLSAPTRFLWTAADLRWDDKAEQRAPASHTMERWPWCSDCFPVSAASADGTQWTWGLRRHTRPRLMSRQRETRLRRHSMLETAPLLSPGGGGGAAVPQLDEAVREAQRKLDQLVAARQAAKTSEVQLREALERQKKSQRSRGAHAAKLEKAEAFLRTAQEEVGKHRNNGSRPARERDGGS